MDDRCTRWPGSAGPVILDGGLGTTLAADGHRLPDSLWSARLLLDDPDAIRAVHTAFVDAGAQVVTTASYQLAARSLASAGRDPDLAPALLRRSVELAREGITAARGGQGTLVAASVGPYGAVLADGSEYRGYDGISPSELAAFHAPRIEALRAAGPDLLAFETIPSADEIAVIGSLMADSDIPGWVSVTLGPDGRTTAEGQPLTEALAPVLDVEEIIAIGVNCCPPELVAPALTALRGFGRPLVAYPNLGDRWDTEHRVWDGGATRRHTSPGGWVETGARLVGGCCGTTPRDIARLATALA